MGKAYYKGGFEKTMNRREAALILETSYVSLAVYQTPQFRILTRNVIVANEAFPGRRFARSTASS